MANLTSTRDIRTDPLISPENSVFVFIDYQPEQFDGVSSRSREELMLNVSTLGRIAHDFSIPTILTTVGVEMGVNQPTVPELRKWLHEIREMDRTTLNSWEDPEFLSAIRQIGRSKIVFAGLWTEVCVAFPVIDAIRSGFEAYPVIDAIGGVTKESHDVAVQRMIQAGAHPLTTLALACELQRDWARGKGHTLRAIMRGYFSDLEALLKKAA